MYGSAYVRLTMPFTCAMDAANEQRDSLHMPGATAARPGRCDPRCCRLQVFVRLAEEGFQLASARVPLSRERVPQAADLDTLRSLHAPPPAGVFSITDMPRHAMLNMTVRYGMAYPMPTSTRCAPCTCRRRKVCHGIVNSCLHDVQWNYA